MRSTLPLRFICIAVVFLIGAPALAQVPIRVAAKTGDPTPGVAGPVFSLLDRAAIGPNGEVVFFAESSDNRDYPAQHQLDLRGDLMLLASDRTFGPLFGAIRDAPVGEGVADSRDENYLRFGEGGHLVVPSQGILSASDLQETDMLVVRTPDGSLQVVAFASTTATTSPYIGAPGLVESNVDGSVLVQDQEGLKLAGDPPTTVKLNTDRPPDDPMAPPYGTAAHLLDDDRVVVCCHRNAPYLWSAGVLSNAGSTPNETNNPTDRLFIGVHRSGWAIFLDVYFATDGTPTPAFYIGQMGGTFDRVADAAITDGCGVGLDAYPEIIHMDGTGRATFTTACGIGQLGATGLIEWIVRTGETQDPLTGSTFATVGPAVHVSDDGNSILFEAETSPGTDPGFSGVWLIPSVGGPVEAVTSVGAAVEVAEGDTRFVQSILIGSGSGPILHTGAVNNLGQAVVTVVFEGAEADVRVPGAVIVANQEPQIVDLADLELLFTDNTLTNDQNSVFFAAEVTNDGPATVYDVSIALDLPPGFELASVDHGVWTADNEVCNSSSGQTVCDLQTADPAGLLAPGESIRLTFNAIRLDFEGRYTTSASVSSSTPDQNMANNTDSFDIMIGLDLSVAEELVGDEIHLIFYALNLSNSPLTDVEFVAYNEEVEDLRAEPAKGSCGLPDNWVECALGILESQEETTVDVFSVATYLEYEAWVEGQTADGVRVIGSASGFVDREDPSTFDGRENIPNSKKKDGGCSTVTTPGQSQFPWPVTGLLLAGLLVWRRRRATDSN